MPHTTYVPKTFKPEHLAVIEQAEAICEQYAEQGLSLTLRQLYYQFVARGLLPNKQNEYKRLGEIVNDARLAGLLDWEYLVDRTRNAVSLRHHDDPADLVRAASQNFLPDLWEGQHEHVEVWIEKDAGIGVIEAVCQRNDITYFSCRGYTSQSEMWSAALRLRCAMEDGKRVTVLHIGDHDPSGVDMSRDIEDRLRTFITHDWLSLNAPHLRGRLTRGDIRAAQREFMRSRGSDIADHEHPWQVKRIALTIDQIRTYQPPPNPAKTTDSRFQRYSEQTGLDESWELDALDPVVLQDLIQDEIDEIRDEDRWARMLERRDSARATLKNVADNWARIAQVHAPREG